jgi:hypothetical protein
MNEKEVIGGQGSISSEERNGVYPVSGVNWGDHVKVCARVRYVADIGRMNTEYTILFPVPGNSGNRCRP